MNIEIEAQYLVIYNLKQRVKIEGYDFLDIAMQRFLSIALTNNYVTLFNMVDNYVECSAYPIDDVKLREQARQLPLFNQ